VKTVKDKWSVFRQAWLADKELLTVQPCTPRSSHTCRTLQSTLCMLWKLLIQN